VNIPISWLKAITPINDSTLQFSEKITNIGLAVESIQKPGEEITGIVIGQIISIEKHPDADRLFVTRADIGSEVLQICTAATNLKMGDYVPVAINGATLANGLKIKKGKMRGQESNGMLVSVEELGYTRDDYPEAPEDGIYVFDKPHPLGADAKPFFGLDEDVLEFDILSNRPDTNSAIGIAREAAALYGNPFVLPEINVKEEAESTASDYVAVEIKDSSRCPRYIARVVIDVHVAPSPGWLRRRLSLAGIRPINNIVDITNYVMLEYGQPLHAFDITAVAKKNGKHNIVVRTATQDEKFTTLDGEKRTLTDTTLLIADCDKAIGIAGIMGGENSRISDDTKTILFESANFDPVSIRMSARQLGMRTDASSRYEKGLDPNLAILSANRAMELIEELRCGKVVPGMVDVYPSPRQAKTFKFKPENIAKQLGLPDLTSKTIYDYLSKLGIKTDKDNNATVPTHRADITIEADLAEEVGRFYGLNRIPSRYIQMVDGIQESASYGPPSYLTTTIKKAAVALGYYEAKTFPFESAKVFDKLLLPQDHKDRTHIAIKNPLGEDMAVMRTLPLNGLLESISRNYNNNNESACLFEVSKTYHPESLPLTKLPKEPTSITLAAYGADMDFLSLKGDVEEMLAALNITNIDFVRHHLPYTHPGKTALIQTAPTKGENKPITPIGYIGEVHPKVCENYEIGTTCYIACLCVETLSQLYIPHRNFSALSVFPAMTRDLALIIPEAISAAEVEIAIRERGGPLLTQVKLFDVYQGPQIESGYKSMAYSLQFRAKDRTLTDKEAQKPLRSIVDNLKNKLGAEVRDK